MVKRGQLFLSSGTGFFSKGVQWFTGSKWNHIGMFLDSKTIIDSDFEIGYNICDNGVRIRDASKYLADPERIKLIDLPFSDEEVDKIVKKAKSYVGMAYDLPLIFSFVWEWWEGDKFFDDMYHRQKAMTCSEFIAQCIYDVTGKEVIKGRLPHTIRPTDFEVYDV